MIRRVELQDAKAIAAIYNEYVIHSVVTFDIEPVREEDMRGRIRTYAGDNCLPSSRLCGERYGNPTHDAFDRRMPEGGLPCTDSLSDGTE